VPPDLKYCSVSSIEYYNRYEEQKAYSQGYEAPGNKKYQNTNPIGAKEELKYFLFSMYLLFDIMVNACYK